MSIQIIEALSLIELNEKANEFIKYKIVTSTVVDIRPLYDLFHGITPSVCNQWMTYFITIIYTDKPQGNESLPIQSVVKEETQNPYSCFGRRPHMMDFDKQEDYMKRESDWLRFENNPHTGVFLSEFKRSILKPWNIIHDIKENKAYILVPKAASNKVVIWEYNSNNIDIVSDKTPEFFKDRKLNIVRNKSLEEFYNF